MLTYLMTSLDIYVYHVKFVVSVQNSLLQGCINSSCRVLNAAMVINPGAWNSGSNEKVILLSYTQDHYQNKNWTALRYNVLNAKSIFWQTYLHWICLNCYSNKEINVVEKITAFMKGIYKLVRYNATQGYLTHHFTDTNVHLFYP